MTVFHLTILVITLTLIKFTVNPHYLGLRPGGGVGDRCGNFRYYKGLRKSNNLMRLQIHFNTFMYTEYLRCLINSFCNTSLLFSTELCVLLTMCTCTFQHNNDVYNHSCKHTSGDENANLKSYQINKIYLHLFHQ